MKKLKSKCCEKFHKKSKACSNCPLMAALRKPERRELIAKYAKKRKKKAA